MILAKNLSSVTKLFAEDTSIFSVVQDVDLSAKPLNDNLNKIFDWRLSAKWLSILICLSKRKKLSFFRKTHKISHPKLNFNNLPIVQDICQKHLGLSLDEKLNFSYHIKEKISKAYWHWSN